MSRPRVTLSLGPAEAPLLGYLQPYPRTDWAGIITRLAHAGLLLEGGKIKESPAIESREKDGSRALTAALLKVCPD